MLGCILRLQPVVGGPNISFLLPGESVGSAFVETVGIVDFLHFLHLEVGAPVRTNNQQAIPLRLRILLMMDSIGLNNRRPGNQSALDKKKKKKRKKRTREGKRSSASSASASGSPDSTGPRQPKAQASQSCPNIVGMTTKENAQPDDSLDFKNDSKINECLRWPAHSLYVENSFKTEIIGKFPVSGLTEDEENERIAIYKMNRRKRYLAAQQALINKYPDVGIYASSSGSSSGHDTNEDGIKMSGSRNVVPSSDAKTLFHSTTQNALSDANNQENIQLKYFSNGDATPNARNGDAPNSMADNRKKVFSGI